MSAEGTDATLMPPPAAGGVNIAQYHTAQQAAVNHANGENADGNDLSRKAKKKNKKKEKRKEKRQQQAIDRIQNEDKLSNDPLHKAFEERMKQEQEAKERAEKLETEQKRLQWEARELEILAEIERKKQEEELRKLEAEEKKRQDEEEREVGLVFSMKYPLLLCGHCVVLYMCTYYTYSFILILLNCRDGNNFVLHNKQRHWQMDQLPLVSPSLVNLLLALNKNLKRHLEQRR